MNRPSHPPVKSVLTESVIYPRTIGAEITATNTDAVFFHHEIINNFTANSESNMKVDNEDVSSAENICGQITNMPEVFIHTNTSEILKSLEDYLQLPCTRKVDQMQQKSALKRKQRKRQII